MYKTARTFVCLALLGIACAGPARVQRPQVADEPVLRIPAESLAEPTGSALSLDQISIADSLRFNLAPSRTLQDARDRYEAALGAATNGDLATARFYVDEALHRLIAISGQRQSSLISERQELERSLSRLVLNMHSGEPLSSPEMRGPIARDTNSRVTKQIDWWRRINPGALKKSYERSGLYSEIISRELARRGMPPELQWLPAVESNFKPRAYSWADAAGLWQFIMGTGSRYGLKRTGYVDDRMDPFKATGAALDYLNDLYEMFGDWNLALAAYNCGENRVLRAINRQGTSDFWKLRLPRETQRYVPRFLAAVYLLEDPETYEIDLPEKEAPYAFEETHIPKSVALVDIASALDVELDRLKELNAGVRYGVTPPQGYFLKVPLGLGAALVASLSDIPEAKFTPPPETLKYRVRRGDTLGHIALRYRTSVRKVKSMNRLRSDRIRIGQVLKIPGKRYNSTVYAASQKDAAPRPKIDARPAMSGPAVTSYTIRRGDNLSKIARRFRTTVSTLRQINGLRNDHLSVGQVVHLPGSKKTELEPANVTETPTETAETLTYKVRRGDTLSEIAERFDIGLSKLTRANPATRARRLQIGQTLTIPGARARMALAETHVVRRGESLWSIARRYELSVARILKMNDLRQGDIIRPGQVLRIAAR